MTGHELALRIRTAYLAMHRQTDAHLAALEITADQFVVLCALSERDALTQRELVDRTSSDPNTIRAMLVLLEERSLIVRRPHATDRRARSVALTPRGRKLLDRLWSKTEPVRQQLVASMTEAQAQTLGQLLERLAETLQPLPPRGATRGKSNDSHEQPSGRPASRPPWPSTLP